MPKFTPRVPTHISPRIQRGIDDLRKNAIEYGPGTEGLKSAAGSDHFEQLRGRVGDAGLSRMFERNQWVKEREVTGRIASDQTPTTILQTRIAQGRYAKPKVEKDVMGNSYDPNTNTVRLMEPARQDRLHYAAHEFRHAYDHTQGKMDFSDPKQRLMGEVNAFGSQIKAAGELGVDPGISGRTAQQQARTYQGKAGYPGTLESSEQAVKDWRKDG